MSTKSQTHSGIAQFVSSNQEMISRLDRYSYEQLKDAKRGQATARANALRANASLPETTWEAVDDTVYRTQEDTLTLVNDLLAQQLTHEVDLNAEVDTWHTLEEQGEAEVGMNPDMADAESSVSYGRDGCPIPLVWDSFSVGFREGPIDGQQVGDSLDTLGATVSSRNVAEATERLFVGTHNIQVTSDGDPFNLYGFTNHPATATGTTSADWTADNTVVRNDLRAMRSVLKNDRNYNPGDIGFWVYLGTEYYDVLDDADPEGDGNQTIRDRVENLASISQVKELDFLDNKGALMFRPTQDVVEVGMATDTTTVQEENPFNDQFMIMDGKYPRIKKTRNGVNGIVYWTA